MQLLHHVSVNIPLLNQNVIQQVLLYLNYYLNRIEWKHACWLCSALVPWIDVLREHPWYGSVAAEAKKGFQAVLDKKDGYSFLYPFGWQVGIIMLAVFPVHLNVSLSWYHFEYYRQRGCYSFPLCLWRRRKLWEKLVWCWFFFLFNSYWICIKIDSGELEKWLTSSYFCGFGIPYLLKVVVESLCAALGYIQKLSSFYGL